MSVGCSQPAGVKGGMKPQLKKLSQEQFDEAVNDMMDGLGLEAEEAIESAVEEFEIQGYSLEGKIKQVGGAEYLYKLPTALAAKALKESVSSNTYEGEEKEEKKEEEERLKRTENLREKVEELRSALNDATSGEREEEQAQLLLASAKCDSVESLFSAIDHAELVKDKSLLRKCLGTIHTQLLSDCARDHFVESEGSRRTLQLLHVYKDSKDSGEEQSEDDDMVCMLLKISALSAKEQEEEKCSLMSDGLPEVVAYLLQKEDTSEQNIEACCSCIKSILTTDDSRPTPLALEAQSGGEFMKALSMDNDGITSALMSCFERHLGKEDMVKALSVAMRKVALNDEICKKFVEEKDCIPMFLSLLRGNTSKDVTLSILMLLKQISACDTVKKRLIEAEAIETAIEMFENFGDSTVIIQSLLYILTNVTLRNPDVAEHFADSGGFEFVLTFINKYLDKPKLMKQVCMLLRNAAVRSSKVKDLLRKADMEKHVRAIQQQHTSMCKDVASAALRDMGIENYN